MITTSDAFQKCIRRSSRTFRSRFLKNGELLNCDVKKVVVQKGACAENFSPGAVYAPYIDAEISNCNDVIEGEELLLQIGLLLDDGTVEYINVGYFTVTKPEGNIYQTKFQAVGRISSRLNSLPDLPEEQTLENLANAITKKTGVNIITNGLTLVETIAGNLNGATCKEVLEAMTSVLGGFATEDGEGNIVISKFTTTSLVEYNGDYLLTPPTFSDYNYNLSGIKVIVAPEQMDGDGNTVAETAYTEGSPKLTLSNVFMTEDLFDFFVQNIVGYSFRPGEMQLTLGDPRIEPWDCISYVDEAGTSYVLPCLNLIHTFDGGLSTAITAKGKNETESTLAAKGPIQKQIERLNADLFTAKDAIIKRLRADEAELLYAKVKELEVVENLTVKLGENLSTLSTKQTILEATADKINWIVASGTSASNMTMTKDAVNIFTKALGIDALVTFKNSAQSGSATVINGASIITGSIKAAQIDVNDLFAQSITATGTIKGLNLEAATGSFSGEITASKGTIGGWNIGTKRITAKNVFTSDDGTETYTYNSINVKGGSSWAFVAGATTLNDSSTAPFLVTHEGKLTAKNAVITGKITAESGSIGGFTIGASAIYNGATTLGGAANSVYLGTGGISCGTTFTVTKAGKLTATDAVITGTITAKSGTIGGFHITEDTIYSGTKATISSTARGVHLDSAGQIALGDADNFLKYYQDTDGVYKLAILADRISFKVNNDRNLLLNSGTDRGGYFNTTSSIINGETYGRGGYRPSTPLIAGQKYTIAMSVTPAEGVTQILVTLSNGNLIVGRAYTDGTTNTQTITATFTAQYTSGRTPADAASNSWLYMYYRPNDGTVTGATTIHWAKVVEGDTVSDGWSPAPEDMITAAQTATNYMSFSSSGLVVGDMTASTLGKNVLIRSGGIDIRDSQTVLAAFAANKIELAKHSKTAIVDFCNGLGIIGHYGGNLEYDRLLIQSADSINLIADFGIYADTAYTDATGKNSTTKILAESGAPWDGKNGAVGRIYLETSSWTDVTDIKRNYLHLDEENAALCFSGSSLVLSNQLAELGAYAIKISGLGGGITIDGHTRVGGYLVARQSVSSGEKGSASDGVTGGVLDSNGWLGLQNIISDTAIRFYGASNSAFAELRYKIDTNYLAFNNATRYTFDGRVDLVGGGLTTTNSLWTGEKRATNDGNAGGCLHADGVLYLQRNNGNPFIGFYGNGQTAYASYIAYNAESDQLRFGGGTSYSFDAPVITGAVRSTNGVYLQCNGTTDFTTARTLEFDYINWDGTNHYACLRPAFDSAAAGYSMTMLGSTSKRWRTVYAVNGNFSNTMTITSVTTVSNRIQPSTDNTIDLGASSARWMNVYCGKSANTTSDLRQKRNLTPLTEDNRYMKLFDLIDPYSYYLLDGDRVHTGFIAQYVEAALPKAGLTAGELGFFCKDVLKKSVYDTDGNYLRDEPVYKNGALQYTYSLRYEEYIAIHVAKTKLIEQTMLAEFKRNAAEHTALNNILQQLLELIQMQQREIEDLKRTIAR